jgi:hypothetical protein
VPVVFNVSAVAIVLTMLISATAVVGRAGGAEEREPRAVLRDNVESLVKQLDAASLAERTHAERSLLDLGPDALPFLPVPDLTPSVAVREAVKRVRRQLERQAARQSAHASTVRLAGEMTVNDVLSEIAKQTRNRVELGSGAVDLAQKSLTVQFDDRPFWECLDDVCARLKLNAVFSVQRSVLQLVPRSPRDPVEVAVQHSGPFRFSIQSADVRPVVGDAERHLLRVTGRVRLEPRLRPLFLHFAAGDVHANSSTKQPLTPWNPAATYELPVGDAGREVGVQFDFVLPSNERAETIDLRGRLSVQLAAGTERIVFDRTSQVPGTSRRRGGVTVRLRDVTFEPQPDELLQAGIGVAVSYDAGGPAFESHRTWMFHNAVYLETEAGRRIDFTDYDTSQQADGAVAVDYRWNKLGSPATQYRFVYEAPTLILDLPLEIKLDRIPIAVASP